MGQVLPFCLGVEGDRAAHLRTERGGGEGGRGVLNVCVP